MTLSIISICGRRSPCALWVSSLKTCIFCLLGGSLSCHVRSPTTLRPPGWRGHGEMLQLTVPAELSFPVLLANVLDTCVKTPTWKWSLLQYKGFQVAAGGLWGYPSHSGLPSWSCRHHRAAWIMGKPHCALSESLTRRNHECNKSVAILRP